MYKSFKTQTYNKLLKMRRQSEPRAPAYVCDVIIWESRQPTQGLMGGKVRDRTGADEGNLMPAGVN